MEVSIEHPFLEHPLILRENVGNDKENIDCYGCGNPIGSGEWVYVCLQEKQGIIFHKRCGELAKQISHPSHPQHPLYLFDFHLRDHNCNLCRRSLGREVGYRCSRCDFDLDLTCKKLGKNELVGEARQLQHSCHIHPLTLMRKPPFVFNCDGCGTEDRDMVYTCSSCDLFIHKACALLPPLLSTNHHHHQLSLSSRFPFHHRNFKYQCAVCDKDFDFLSWVYYCGDCRFFAHIKCAISDKHSNLEQEKDDNGSMLLQFPLEECEIPKELITPFVIRENGLDKITGVKDMPNAKKFNYHHVHTLSLVSELSDQDYDDDDDEEVHNNICNVCVTPISSLPYYECAPCNYFVHSVCYLLPKTLSSLEAQLYGNCWKTNKNHKFTLYATSKMELLWCYICLFDTNGMVYQCEACKMTIDIKCLCLPTTIKYASHPSHKFIKTRMGEENQAGWCHGCGSYNGKGSIVYLCTVDDCDFALCPRCILLPKSVMKREWDKHPLPLTFDASIDHPTDFYCGFCETEMHPKEWMYHCRPCDNSFHRGCLETESGGLKNVKLGHPLELNRNHPHTLTFSYITLRKRCSICHENVYKCLAFVCSSCYYVACQRCGHHWVEN